jgi:hypothetical protein
MDEVFCAGELGLSTASTDAYVVATLVPPARPALARVRSDGSTLVAQAACVVLDARARCVPHAAPTAHQTSVHARMPAGGVEPAPPEVGITK